jgi:membrane protease YdiL (CAAX protease family)
MNKVQPDPPNLLVLAIVFEGGMGLVAWALGHFLDRPPLEQIQFDASGVLWGIVGTLPLLLMLWGMMRLRWGPIEELRTLVREMVAPMFEGAGWLQIAVVAALAGIGEELLFRGVIQESIGARFGVAVGLASASMLFGLAHPISKAYGYFAAGMGLYLGLLAVVAENLLAPIIAHGLYDFVAVIWVLRSHASNKTDESAAQKVQEPGGE